MLIFYFKMFTFFINNSQALLELTTEYYICSMCRVDECGRNEWPGECSLSVVDGWW